MSTPLTLNEKAFVEHKASWLELFFDLAYVAAVAQLTYALISSHGTFLEYAEFTLIFVIVYLSWLGAVSYKNLRGDVEDKVDRFATIVQMFFVLVMSVFLQTAFSTGAVGFVLGFVGTRMVMTYLIARMYRLDPENAPKSKHILYGFQIAHVLWAVTLFVPQPMQGVLWAILALYEFLIPHAEHKTIKNEVRIINRFHLPERLGLFTILVMGESVIVVAVVNNIAESLFTLTNGLIATCSFAIVAGLWWMYFDHVERFATGKRFQLFLYMHTHMPIMLGIIFLAVGTKVGMLDKTYGVDPFWLAAAGLALTIVGFNGLKVATGQRIPRMFAPSGVFVAFLVVGTIINNLSFLYAMIVLMCIYFIYMKVEHTECHVKESVAGYNKENIVASGPNVS